MVNRRTFFRLLSGAPLVPAPTIREVATPTVDDFLEREMRDSSHPLTTWNDLNSAVARQFWRRAMGDAYVARFEARSLMKPYGPWRAR